MTLRDPSHEAEAFLSLLWRHIYQRVRAMIHPHWREHGPGGNDPVELPLGFMTDVWIPPPVGDTYVLMYILSESRWEARPCDCGGGGPGLAAVGKEALQVKVSDNQLRKRFLPAGGRAAAVLVLHEGEPITDASTFDGYTLAQVVKALRCVGVLP